MNAVGIDIGQATHVVAVCADGERSARRGIQRISATRAGFDELDRWLELHGPVSRVVLESSGHYWMPLVSHLSTQAQPVALINPLASKYFAKRHLARAKSDPADARTLATLGMVDQPAVANPLSGAELREAARFALRLVEEQAKLAQRIVRLIDLGFPELRTVWDDPTCTSALAVLRIAPTARQAARKRIETLARANQGPGQRAIGRAKAEQVHRLAQRTIAVAELEDQLAFEMQLLVAQHDVLERQIALAEDRVAGMLDSALAKRLRTIPGCGPAIAATLIAEIGDIERFSSFDRLVAFAGVHAKEQSSGQTGADPQTSWRMAKTGSPYLRTALYRLAVVGIQHNPVLKAHYARKRAAGKSKMNALGHCMKKALAIVWGVWRSGRDFDPQHSA